MLTGVNWRGKGEQVLVGILLAYTLFGALAFSEFEASEQAAHVEQFNDMAWPIFFTGMVEVIMDGNSLYYWEIMNITFSEIFRSTYTKSAFFLLNLSNMRIC